MQARYMICGELVRKYKNEIMFLVSRDYCYIEVVEPRIKWFLELPYEVSLEEVKNNIDTLLKLSVDPNEEGFGIATMILIKIIKEKV